MRKSNVKIFALGGIAGPILFALIILICASLRTDYNHMHNFISELGATNTPHDQLMNFVGFIPSGLLLCLFSISLLKIIPKRFVFVVGPFLILIFGFGMILAGIFSCDPGCPTTGSIESTIHDSVSAVAFLSAILGISVSGFSFWKWDFFRNVALYSILSGIISAVLLILMINSFESRVYTGLWQRLLLFTIFLWTAIIGLQIFRSHKKPKSGQ